MSREIKFRAWDLDNKKYEYDIAIRPINKIIGIEIYNNEMYPVEFRAIVEQYTGLKDKNGKDIYEGDIVKYKLYADSRLDYIDEVFYSTISGAFMVGDEDNIRTLDCLINVEVIGNVHENKELLGDKK